MAEVVHTIKNNQYLYKHYRQGDKVISEYIGPLGSGGKVRTAQHGGGAPPKVTQHPDEKTVEGKDINSIKDNSRIEQKAQEKSTVNKIKIGEDVAAEYERVIALIGGVDQEIVLWNVKKDGVIINAPLSHEKEFTEDQLDKIEDTFRKIRNDTGIDTLREEINLKYDGKPLERRNMYYAKGDTYPVKDELKAAGMKWNSDLKTWESPNKPSKEFAGITFEKIPTYKTENLWGWY